MLDTKGDTAVYLLFAYARVASILRKVLLFTYPNFNYVFTYLYVCMYVCMYKWWFAKTFMWMMNKRRNLINSSIIDDENSLFYLTHVLYLFHLKLYIIANEERLYFAELTGSLCLQCWQNYKTLIYIVWGISCWFLWIHIVLLIKLWMYYTNDILMVLG